MEKILLRYNYKKEGYGYKRVTEENTHWVTLFDNNLQMYAYFTDDDECEKIYDTGVIAINETQLCQLIDIFINNHD